MAKQFNRSKHHTFTAINEFCFPVVLGPVVLSRSLLRASRVTGYIICWKTISTAAERPVHKFALCLCTIWCFTFYKKSVLLKQITYAYVLCRFGILQKADGNYNLVGNPVDQHLQSKASSELSVLRQPKAAHTSLVLCASDCTWKSEEMHKVWFCFEVFPGCERFARHICGYTHLHPHTEVSQRALTSEFVGW